MIPRKLYSHWRTNEQGMTLLELLLALMLSSVVMLALNSVFYSELQSWKAGTNSSLVQEHVRMAVDQVVESIREADNLPAVNVTAYGSELRVTRTVSGVEQVSTFTLTPDGLAFVRGSQPAIELLPGEVKVNPGSRFEISGKDVLVLLDVSSRGKIGAANWVVKNTARPRTLGFR